MQQMNRRIWQIHEACFNQAKIDWAVEGGNASDGGGVCLLSCGKCGAGGRVWLLLHQKFLGKTPLDLLSVEFG